jgi:hypothetical protein
MAQYTMRPSRSVSTISGVVGLILGIAGLAYFGSRFASSGGSAVPLVFVAVWVAVCFALTGYHLYNAATGRGPATEVIERDDGAGR